MPKPKFVNMEWEKLRSSFADHPLIQNVPELIDALQG